MKIISRITLAAMMIILTCSVPAMSAELETHKKFTLYIGLNDVETGEQVYPVNEAKKIFNEIACKYTDGYTLYEADGFWREGKDIFSEHTFVCVIVDADEEKVKALMNDTMKALKQRSILLEVSDTRSMFYSGE